MYTTAHNQYRNSAVQTASPSKLLMMLYDGAIRFVLAGIEGITSSDYQKANLNLGKAQSIVSELNSTLNRSIPVSSNLEAIYEYITYLLTQSNINKDDAPANEALGYLRDLRATWEQASRMSAVSGN